MPSSPAQRVVIVGGELFWQCDACKRKATWFWNTERLRLRFCDRHKPFPAPVSHSAPEIPERLKEKATEEVYVRNRRKYSDLTEEDVARWAQLRREGKSQLWIQKNDALGPSPPTLKKYLAEYGYDSDGRSEPLECEEGPEQECGQHAGLVRYYGDKCPMCRAMDLLHRSKQNIEACMQNIPFKEVGATPYTPPLVEEIEEFLS